MGVEVDFGRLPKQTFVSKVPQTSTRKFYGINDIAMSPKESSVHDYTAILALTPVDDQQYSTDADIHNLLRAYNVGGAPPEIIQVVRIRVMRSSQPVYVVFSSHSEAKAIQAQFKSPGWIVESLENATNLRMNFDRQAKNLPAPHRPSLRTPPPEQTPLPFAAPTPLPAASAPLPASPTTSVRSTLPSPIRPVRSLPLRHRRDAIPAFELNDTLAGRCVQPPRPADRVLCLTPTITAAFMSPEGNTGSYASDVRIRELLHGCGDIEYVTRWKPFKAQSPFPHIFVTFKTAHEAQDGLRKFGHLDWEIQSLDAKLTAEYTWSLREKATPPPIPVKVELGDVPFGILSPLENGVMYPMRKGSEVSDYGYRPLQNGINPKAPPSPSMSIPMKRLSDTDPSDFRAPRRRPKRSRGFIASMSPPELEREVVYLEDALDEDYMEWLGICRRLDEGLAETRRQLELEQRSRPPASPVTSAFHTPPTTWNAQPAPCPDCPASRERADELAQKLEEERSQTVKLAGELAQEKATVAANEKELEILRALMESEKSKRIACEKLLEVTQDALRKFIPPSSVPLKISPQSHPLTTLTTKASNASGLLQTCTDERRKLWEAIASGNGIQIPLPAPSPTTTTSALGSVPANGVKVPVDPEHNLDEILKAFKIPPPSQSPYLPATRNDDGDLESMDESDD